MTPKEKAIEIINKFYRLRAIEVMDKEDRAIAYGISKQSAVIAVDLLIESSSFTLPSSYWNLVKNEINNL